MKYLKALAATAGFVALLLAVYVVHVRLFKVDVVLYSALLDVATASVVAAGLFHVLPVSRGFNGFEKAQLVAIWLLGGYVFAISVPTVLDRSLSFYILEKLQQRGGGILYERLEQVFTREYVREHRVVDVRLTEQLESGTIEIENGCVKLTPRGDRLATFSRTFRLNFLPRERLLLGRYSDDLTDPFRGGVGEQDYRCR